MANRSACLKLAALLLVALLAPSIANACDAKSESVFSCKTTNRKFVEVCDAGSTLTYSFGKLGKKPELSFSVPRASASTYQWQGIGRYENHAVYLPNGQTTYSVFFGVDRLTESHDIEAGVNVEKNGVLVATVYCDAATLKQSLEGISLRPVDLSGR